LEFLLLGHRLTHASHSVFESGWSRLGLVNSLEVIQIVHKIWVSHDAHGERLLVIQAKSWIDTLFFEFFSLLDSLRLVSLDSGLDDVKCWLVIHAIESRIVLSERLLLLPQFLSSLCFPPFISQSVILILTVSQGLRHSVNDLMAHECIWAWSGHLSREHQVVELLLNGAVLSVQCLHGHLLGVVHGSLATVSGNSLALLK
jgi:hypothetical protein